MFATLQAEQSGYLEWSLRFEEADLTLEDGRITRRHVDHIRERSDSTSAEPTDIWLADSIESPDSPTSTTPETTTPDSVPVLRSSCLRVASDRFDLSY